MEKLIIPCGVARGLWDREGDRGVLRQSYLICICFSVI